MLLLLAPESLLSAPPELASRRPAQLVCTAHGSACDRHGHGSHRCGGGKAGWVQQAGCTVRCMRACNWACTTQYCTADCTTDLVPPRHGSSVQCPVRPDTVFGGAQCTCSSLAWWQPGQQPCLLESYQLSTSFLIPDPRSRPALRGHRHPAGPVAGPC